MKTVSLEIAKQLKEAGYPQEAHYFFWENIGNKEEKPILMRFQGTEKNQEYLEKDYPNAKYNCFASPTADELLDQLPRALNGDCWKLQPTLAKENSFTIEYEYSNTYTWKKDREDGECLADVVAKMWLYLKKEGLLDKEVSGRTT